MKFSIFTKEYQTFSKLVIKVLSKEMRVNGFYEIQKELVRYDSLAENYFKKSLNEYLDFLSREDKIEKVFLTSFPHISTEKDYKVNVSKYIDEVLYSINNKKFVHLI